jgi:hypothetical protein
LSDERAVDVEQDAIGIAAQVYNGRVPSGEQRTARRVGEPRRLDDEGAVDLDEPEVEASGREVERPLARGIDEARFERRSSQPARR